MHKSKSAHMDHYVGGGYGDNSAVVLLENDYTTAMPVRPPEIAGLKRVIQYRKPQSHKEAMLIKILVEKIMGCGEKEFGQLQEISQSWESWRGISQEDYMPQLGSMLVSLTTVAVEIIEPESDHTHSGHHFGGIAFGD